jgi:hypothetical protein
LFLHSQTASKQFQNLLATARCRLKNYDLAVQLATLEAAVTDGTTLSKLAIGAVGQSISRPLKSMMTPFSQHFSEVTNTDLLWDSLPQSEPMTSSQTPVHQQLLHQYLAQSEPPLMWWLRPTVIMTFQA